MHHMKRSHRRGHVLGVVLNLHLVLDPPHPVKAGRRSVHRHRDAHPRVPRVPVKTGVVVGHRIREGNQIIEPFARPVRSVEKVVHGLRADHRIRRRDVPDNRGFRIERGVTHDLFVVCELQVACTICGPSEIRGGTHHDRVDAVRKRARTRARHVRITLTGHPTTVSAVVRKLLRIILSLANAIGSEGTCAALHEDFQGKNAILVMHFLIVTALQKVIRDHRLHYYTRVIIAIVRMNKARFNAILLRRGVRKIIDQPEFRVVFGRRQLQVGALQIQRRRVRVLTTHTAVGAHLAVNMSGILLVQHRPLLCDNLPHILLQSLVGSGEIHL
mmetsp:Transcript_17819/g.50180  ORF Transcript_17819/g.50180 Transcript_17819/m.50180 type:complete len:329 (-) Transcript_17819:514-1500(-)